MLNFGRPVTLNQPSVKWEIIHWDWEKGERDGCFYFYFIYLEFLSFSSKLKEKRKQMFVHPMTLSTQSTEADAQMLLVIWKCNFQINLRLASRWDPLATCKHITEPGSTANICLIVNSFVEIKFVMNTVWWSYQELVRVCPDSNEHCTSELTHNWIMCLPPLLNFARIWLFIVANQCLMSKKVIIISFYIILLILQSQLYLVFHQIYYHFQ